MDDLIDILLRQFKRPLASVGIDLTPQDVSHVAALVAGRRPLDDRAMTIRAGLVQVVQHSLEWFQAHDLTFRASLQTDMGAMPGWETTSEFLDLANQKSNAELRVAGGAALLATLGDGRYTAHLRFLVDHPHLDEVSAVMAGRVLAFTDAPSSGGL